MTRNYLLLGVLTTSAALTLSVSAQEADQAAELEEIVVTGSYLFTGLDSPSPVVVISGDELINTAPADLATYFFDNVPQNNARAPSFQTENDFLARSRSTRTASVNLRALGGENTLILLNGRRTIENPVPNNGGWRVTDINSLVPRIAIGRVDLLLDGGSSIYGSDAVAGVINSVTRNDFEGFDLALDSRFFEEDTSAKDITLAALWGAGNETSHVIAAIEWHETDELLQDVNSGTFETDPNVDFLTGTGLSREQYLEYTQAGRGTPPSWVDPDCGNPALGVPVRAYYPSYETSDDVTYLSPNPWTDAPGAGPDPTTVADICSQPTGFNQARSIQNDSEQLMIFVAAEHNFSDALYAKAEVNISRQRFNDLEIWGDRGGAAWNPTTPANSGLAYATPVNHPGRLRAVSIDPSFAIGGRGAPTPQTVYIRGETLPFQQEMEAYSETDVWRTAFTLGGDITNDWQWKVDATAAYSTVRSASRDMIKDNYSYAINGLGGANCNPAVANDPLDPMNDSSRGVAIVGQSECFYYNPFMSSALPDAASLLPAGAVSSTGLANDPAMLEWLIPLRLDTFEAEYYSADAQITGSFGNLPGGPIGLAFGGGVRSDTVSRDSDRLVNAGLTASIGVFNDFKGRQKVYNFYGEMALPVHEDVSIQLAARYEDYVDGFSETSPKIAVLWTPTDDLVLRASWGQSFKAPSVIHTQSETFVQGGGRENITIGGVEYGGGRGIRTVLQILPNPELLPQTSDNWSVGGDYNITDNISVGVTYIGIDFTNRISNPTTPQVVSDIGCIFTDENNLPITDAVFPPGHPQEGEVDPTGFIQWNVFGDPALGGVLETTNGNKGCMIASDPNNGFAKLGQNDVSQAVAQPRNLGYLNVEALDIRANMFWDTPIGMVSFTPNVSIFTKYEFPRGSLANADAMCPASGDPTTQDDDVCDGVAREIDFAETSIQSIPRWQGTFTGGLRFGDHNIRLTARYTDGVNLKYEDVLPSQQARFDHEEGIWTLDVNYSWQLSAASGINVSARNVFATEPPANSSSFFNRNLRTYSLQFTHSFAN